MAGHKRNQVEEAISRVLEPRSKEPTTELRTRLKRLLETDRALGRTPKANDPELASYAFYSSNSPGSGVEVWFSDYEAFGLLTGLRLMGHGWPQGFAVSVMRRVRTELEREHTRILKQDRKQLFDADAIRRKAKEGDMAHDVTDPVLLTIVSRSGAKQTEETKPIACAVRRGDDKAMQFFRESAGPTSGGTIFEVASVAHKLAAALLLTEPSRRGPKGD